MIIGTIPIWRKSMRYSRQREVILGILRRERRHYSAAEIYGLAREELPDVSLGTVYRNLGKLCEEGEIRTVETDERTVLYDGCADDHAHMVCRVCSSVYDLPLDEAERPQTVGDGFLVERMRTVYYGICRRCREGAAGKSRPCD